ncbi:MAG: LamG domain-containing protein, partial [Cytophagales bacterium]|nr:LamG domain-containing protein [Cytophagales bacterium]
MKALKLLLIGGLYALMPLFTYAQGANVSSPPLTGDQVPLNQPGHIIDLGDSLFVVGGSSTSYLINDASQSGTLHTQSDLQDQLNLAYLTARSQGSNGETTFYLFSQAFKTSFTGKASTPELVLGGFLEDEAHAIDPELVSATNKENANDSQVSLTSITVSWASVSNAEGYLLFRYDNRNPAINAFDTPYQVLEGQQATRYTDDDLTIGSSYTYYVMAYGVTRGNRFLSPAVGVAGNTLNLSFTANALTEARVQFSFQVDHYTFLQQVNEALYVIIQDKESDRVMHEELLSLSHIRSEELLFDHALMLSGNGTQGVFLTPSIESDLSHWTLELWLNPQREANGKMSLFESGDGLSVGLDASGYLVAEKGQESLTSTVAVSNRWNHLAFSSEDGQLSFYLNGSLIGSGDFTAGPLTPSMSIGKFNGQIGLVRMWSKARSAEQVEADYMDIFLGQPHQFLDLHGQWRFEDKNSITGSIDDISQKQLAIASTNPGTYPLLIDASNFDGGVKTYVAQVWLEHPTTAGSHRIKDYLVQLFEEGTGRRLSVESDTTQFPQPAAPIVTLNQQQAGPFKVKITIDPVTPTGTLTADQYEVRRARLAGNEATNEIVLGTYPIDRSTGSPSSIEVEDAYAYDNPNTLGGGNQYQYTVIPRYDNTLVTKRDTANALTTGPEEVPDIQLQASGTDQVLVSWQPGGWQYDHLILERDNEILSNISGKDYLEDSLVLNGQPYEYKIVALKDGLPAFEQRTNFSIAPNGVFKGYLLTGDDYVLPNATFKVMGAGESIETLTNANGAFQVSELFYGKQANFKATMEGDTLDHDFELSYAEPAIHQALVNTSITPYQAIDSNTDFVTFQQPVVEHNAVTYAWTKIDETREVYINVYQKNEQRQSQLIRVIPPGGENRIRLYDGGTQEVRFVAYYFLLGGDAVVKQEYDATVTNQVHADVTLSAKVTTEQLLSLDWSYPASDTVDHFVVKRMQLSTDNGVDNTSYTVGQLPQQPADSLYQVLDISGHPNTTYYYVLEMMTRSGELLSVDTLEYTYPSPGQVIHTINAQNHNRYKIKLEEDRIHDRSWQGISVRVVDEVTGETLQEALLSKDLVVNGNEILYYHPQDAAQPGTSLEFQPFKQEVYVNTAKSEAFKATRVAKSSQLPDQLTPSPTTTNELQVPVPYASKDARNQVFLSWTYPDYTDVTFKVEKTRWTEGWTPGDWDGNNPDYPVERFTLPGNRRSLVDTTHAGTSIAGDTVIYRIMAEFHKIDEEGAITEKFYSDWAADHGVARRYHQVGGHVFNAKGTPQPFVWVGIGDQWTLSDAAGHYILNDLEL